MQRIRVLVVDDSPFVCRLLSGHLNSAEDIEVVGTALNGKRAVELIGQLQPDVVTLDQQMPNMSGVESLERIMHEHPTPVVMITGVSKRSAGLTRKALSIGAVDFVLKYTPGVDMHPETLQHEIISKVRAASQIRVIRSIRRREERQNGVTPAPVRKKLEVPQLAIPEPSKSAHEAFVKGGVVVIGASTGGPVALRELLKNFPPHFRSAILVVQHMPASFTEVLAEQLNRHTTLPVTEAAHGDVIQAGRIYVAPGDQHMLIGSNSRIFLNNGPKIRGHRPSIDVTMQSVVQVYGAKTRGVVLTGMGDDGAEGLTFVRASGGSTFAQDAETCVVNGMPQRARDRGVVDRVGTPQQLGEYLISG